MKDSSGFVIISLGGSIVVPDEIDIGFLKKFRQLIIHHVKKGRRFIIIVGGGRTCRKYQKAASGTVKVSHEDLDWIGIHSTRLNAQLLRTIFHEVAYPFVIKNYNERIQTKKPVLIATGWKPGHSTDYDAAMWAKNFKARTILNLSDIDYVYDKDPDLEKDAKPFSKMSWKDFRKLVGNEWNPGLNVPFDPIASKKVQELGIKVVIMNGRDFQNMDDFLSGKPFKGTVIEG